MFNEFLIQTQRCGQTRHYKSPADSANGAVVVNGPAALSLINYAYHTQSTKDLLHFSLCPSFDAATDSTLMMCGMFVAHHTLRGATQCHIKKRLPQFLIFSVDVQEWTLILRKHRLDKSARQWNKPNCLLHITQWSGVSGWQRQVTAPARGALSGETGTGDCRPLASSTTGPQPNGCNYIMFGSELVGGGEGEGAWPCTSRTWPGNVDTGACICLWQWLAWWPG